MANVNKYPTTLTGLYKNNRSEKFVLNSAPISQEYADQVCEAIQAAVGGILSVREWGGVSKAGKQLPDFKLEAVSAEQLAERKAFGEARKAERQGDDSL